MFSVWSSLQGKVEPANNATAHSIFFIGPSFRHQIQVPLYYIPSCSTAEYQVGQEKRVRGEEEKKSRGGLLVRKNRRTERRKGQR